VEGPSFRRPYGVGKPPNRNIQLPAQNPSNLAFSVRLCASAHQARFWCAKMSILTASRHYGIHMVCRLLPSRFLPPPLAIPPRDFHPKGLSHVYPRRLLCLRFPYSNRRIRQPWRLLGSWFGPFRRVRFPLHVYQGIIPCVTSLTPLPPVTARPTLQCQTLPTPFAIAKPRKPNPALWKRHGIFSALPLPPLATFRIEAR